MVGRRVILILLFSNVVLTIISVFLFLRLDQLVHGDLYRYGLVFDYAWAGPYWTYARLILGLIGLQIVITGAVIGLILRYVRVSATQSSNEIQTHFKLSSRKLVSPVMFLVGSLALAFSIGYTSKILAFIGLGLILWSILLFYVISEK